MEDDTLLLVMGDHGSTSDGDHGGASELVCSHFFLIFSNIEKHRNLMQLYLLIVKNLSTILVGRISRVHHRIDLELSIKLI